MTKDMKKAKDTRTPEQKDSLVTLMQELIYKYNKDITIHGHNEFANKACPSVLMLLSQSIKTYKALFLKSV